MAQSEMKTSRFDAGSVDENRIKRDYAVMRLEYLSSLADQELALYSKQDVDKITEEFHRSQIYVMMHSQDEFSVTISFEQKSMQLIARIASLKPTLHSSSELGKKPVVQAKLPKLSIKPFDGYKDNWIAFIELFDSLIHNRSEISNVEKLHYLLFSVQGTAYELIKNFPMSGDSYQLAYEALRKHYHNPRSMVSMYYDRIVNCESAKSSSDLERLCRTFSENLSILEKFEQPDQNFMLVHLLLGKLDKQTREQFELSHCSNKIPRLEDIQTFIETRYKALNAAKGAYPIATNRLKVSKSSALVASVPVMCPLCQSSHCLSECPKFIEMDTSNRFNFVKKNHLCINCLSLGHSVKNCTSPKCGLCKFSHNKLLHFNKSKNSITSCIGSTSQTKINKVLFATARVLVKNNLGYYVPVRVLLDSASSNNFITKSCAKALGLKIKPNSLLVTGIGEIHTKPVGSITCDIKPCNKITQFKRISALVMENICPNLPTENINLSTWNTIKKLNLADPKFNETGPIDILLNAEVYAWSLLPGIRHGSAGQPTAIETLFGWILMGGYVSENGSYTCQQNLLSLYSQFDVNTTLKKFWELENVPSVSSILSKEERDCEDIFKNRFYRSSDRKFVVPLPFTSSGSSEIETPEFTGTRSIASKRFLSMEKRLLKTPELYKQYTESMQDYINNSHMQEIEPPKVDCGKFYYIPQLIVSRKDSATTPLRTVFNASSPDYMGNSLNSKLLAGPKLQNSIFDITLRFRWHAVVFTADVKQMYRQCWIEPAHADYQRIVFRSSPEEPLQDYKLKTVTFGVSSAPFLALRSISQLAKEADNSHPIAAQVIARDVYVDDFVTGADSIEEALILRDDIRSLLSSGGFHLRKWTSNCNKFFVGLESSDLYSESFRNFESFDDTSLKVLGLIWQPQVDNFSFDVVVEDSLCTKRQILSEIARIFDPLGFLTPLSFLAKYIMQRLWAAGVGWDDIVPDSISQKWSQFKSELSSLSSLTIPRRMVVSFVDIELHGFCDASERGFCAVLYCRSVNADGSSTIQFCCAKSKVAPLRTISIPRLELQGAALLSDLLIAVLKALEPISKIKNIYAWCDSTVALSWIKSCPSKWKTFVANRVSHIQENVAPENWRHVPTEYNPADCGSRGLMPSDLVAHNLWWNGPSWLSTPELWPIEPTLKNKSLTNEEQKVQSFVISTTDNIAAELLIRLSSLKTIKHVVAYILRFSHNSRIKDQSKKLTGPLLPVEIKNSLFFLVKYCQSEVFASEIGILKENGFNSLPKPFRKLSPFLDEAGLLRVGGRLAKADVTFEVKHPLLLPNNHRLTFLIIDEFHRQFLHPGLQTLHNLLSQHFWIFAPKRAIRSVISRCFRCFRARPAVAAPPFMGNLPGYRINQIKPFSTVAVDFCGPFNISLGRFRGSKTYKSYVCVFVCTSTKAVHLELISELTADAFLAGFRRFISRRGRCHRIVSDQGTNFVGASNILQNLAKSISHTETLEWSFNPPGSPHFSGLAEAGVKSIKTHISRVIGLQRLTFEEFSTLLAQIEALLNSRPLTPVSSDPTDLSVLTPGHFLTLEPLTTVPEENLVDIRVSLMQRWRLLQQMHQSFWERWHTEYIHTLQQRMKWTKNQDNLTIGRLVLVIDEQKSNPMHWKLGRIAELHLGSDGVCRVVTVRTASGLLRRPVVKLCPLPNAA